MPETATYSHLARRSRMEALRMLIWIEQSRFQGFGCSECAWTFNPSGPPAGNWFQEMKSKYQRLRDKEWRSTVCAEHPKAMKANAGVIPAPLRTTRPALRFLRGTGLPRVQSISQSAQNQRRQ
jgi:hypothetical protein